MHIGEILDPIDLEQAIECGYVRRQTHPDDESLLILNYTELAVYSRTWTGSTLNCRGLIVRETGAGDMAVVARPWPKFFNHGEHADGSLDLAAPVEVTDKIDGSLGILHPAPDGRPAIATRGSFASEQAAHATALYRAEYEGAWTPVPGWTYLFEIVYPGNRIVLDYGPMDDLVLLGAVNIATGEVTGPVSDITQGWPGPRTEIHEHCSIAEALAAEPRPNAEGLVVRYLAGDRAGMLLKIKQADYVALHRIMTGLTARRLWERAAVFAVLADDPDVPVRRLAQLLHMDSSDVQGIIDAGPDWADEVRKTAPEEFTEWIDATLSRLAMAARVVLLTVRDAVADWEGADRKTIARGIADHPFRGMVFAAIDGKSIVGQAWAEIRPDAEKPFAARSEDVA